MLMYFHRRAICALLHGPAAQDQAVTIQNLGPCRLHAWQDTHLPGIAGPISYYATRQHARSLQSKHKASGSSKSGAGAEAEAAPGAAAAQPASGSWWIPASTSLQADAAAPAQVRLHAVSSSGKCNACRMHAPSFAAVSTTASAAAGRRRTCGSRPCPGIEPGCKGELAIV